MKAISGSMRLGQTHRSARGNMLVLITAITLGIVMALLFFGLKYTRLLGSNQEQKTAIEAAALQAANDLSRVVVEDPNFGFIGISDYAPKNTPNAGDQYPVPCQSINNLLAAIRLRMIVADQLNDSTMRQMAVYDYNLAMTAKNNLVSVLQSAMQPGGGGATDINGATVDPYDDAIAAYEQNVVRMTGGANHMVRGSMKLTIGCVVGTPTNASIPQPAPTYSNINMTTQQQNGYYKAYIDVPYGGYDFVFGGIGRNSVTLVDNRSFSPAVAGLPYNLPTIVQAEADQLFNDTNQDGTATQRTIHAAACAEPASNNDPLPQPGALALSFPDGNDTPLSSPGDILTNPTLANGGGALQTSQGGDFPAPGTGTLVNLPGGDPVIGSNPSVSNTTRRLIYNFIRQAGTKANVQATIDMMITPFNNSNPAAGTSNVYAWNQNGTIQYTVLACSATPYPAVSHNQLYQETISQGANTSGFFNFGNQLNQPTDIFAYAYTYQAGRPKGGIHAGQPYWNAALENTGLTSSGTLVSMNPGSATGADFVASGSGACSCGSHDGHHSLPAGSSAPGGPANMYPAPGTIHGVPAGLRPTYQLTGDISEIRFRTQGP